MRNIPDRGSTQGRGSTPDTRSPPDIESIPITGSPPGRGSILKGGHGENTVGKSFCRQGFVLCIYTLCPTGASSTRNTNIKRKFGREPAWLAEMPGEENEVREGCHEHRTAKLLGVWRWGALLPSEQKHNQGLQSSPGALQEQLRVQGWQSDLALKVGTRSLPLAPDRGSRCHRAVLDARVAAVSKGSQGGLPGGSDGQGVI